MAKKATYHGSERSHQAFQALLEGERARACEMDTGLRWGRHFFSTHGKVFLVLFGRHFFLAVGKHFFLAAIDDRGHVVLAAPTSCEH